MKHCPWRSVHAAVLLAVVAAGGGCLHGGAGTAAANKPAADTALPEAGAVRNADRYKVTADTTPFFRYGPQQLNGSDLDLKKETRITMVKRGRGYSQVRIPDGQTGYVGTEDVSALDANEIAAEDAQKLAAAAALLPPNALNSPATNSLGGGRGGSYRSGPPVTIPSDAGRSESLPTNDPNTTPTPPPSTIFRY